MRKIYRSSAVTLALLGSAGLLTSCGEEEKVDTAVFENVQQCVQSGKTETECNDAFEAAKIDAKKNAPAFSKKELCEEEFGAGNCETNTSVSNPDGSFPWMPVLAGFMLGNMMSSNTSQHIYPQAVYRDKDDRKGYVNGGGYVVARGIGATRVSPYTSRGTSVSAPSVRAPVVTARGGFGGIGRGVSVGG